VVVLVVRASPEGSIKKKRFIGEMSALCR